MINRTISYLPDGTRILAHDPSKPGSTAFAEVKSNQDGTRDLLTSDGVVYQYQGYGSFRNVDNKQGLAVAWAGPFPRLSDEAIIRYYDKLVQIERDRRHSSNPAFLVHVTEVSDGSARAKIVEGLGSQPRHVRVDEEQDKLVLGHVVVSGSAINLSTAELPVGSKAGDLLISSDFSCEATVNKDNSFSYVFKLEGPLVLGHAASAEQLLHLIPDASAATRSSEYEKLGFTFQSFDIMSAGDVRYQEDAARAKTERDLGLFLSIPDENGECYPVFLTGTGIQLFGHNLYGVEDLLKTPCPPQGVWAYENPEFYAGATQTDIGPEWSEELNGSFVPATAEHIEQLEFSMGALGEAILEHMRDNRHDIRGEPLQVAEAWLELAPSYSNASALTF